MKTYIGLYAFILTIVAAPQACGSTLANVPWPKLAKCGAPVVDDLLNSVIAILRSGPANLDVLSARAEVALEELARQDGATAVSCAVAQAVANLRAEARRPKLGSWIGQERDVSAERSMSAARRGNDFLANHHIAIEQ